MQFSNGTPCVRKKGLSRLIAHFAWIAGWTNQKIANLPPQIWQLPFSEPIIFANNDKRANCENAQLSQSLITYCLDHKFCQTKVSKYFHKS